MRVLQTNFFAIFLGLSFASLPAFAVDESTPIASLSFKDAQLSKCVQDWSAEDINEYQTAGEIHELACAHYGIQSLEGIEQLPNLLAIDLSYNVVTDYSPLLPLEKKLGFLWVWGTDMGCSTLVYLHQNLPSTWIGGIHYENCRPDSAGQ